MKKYTCLRHSKFVALLFSVFISSLVSAQWYRKADGLKPRSDLKETVLSNSKLYVFCGFANSLRIADSTSEVYNPATNTWKYIAPLPLKAAVTHECALLIDNTIWLIGGRLGTNPGPLTSSIWIYNITTNSWSKGPDVRDPATGKPMVIAAGGGVLLGRVLHLFGGFTPTACNNDQDKYHLTLDVDTWLANRSQPAKWENKLKPLPMKRNHFSSVVLGGKIYALGGQLGHDCDGGQEVPYCHVYNPSTNTWTQLTSLPSGRSHAEGATFAIDGKIYMIGGQGSDGNSTAKIAIFDPAGNNGAGKWTESSSLALPYIYEGLSARIVGSKIIISHGSRGSSKYPEKATCTRSITRKPIYKFGLPSECLHLNDSSSSSLKAHTLLFTIDSSKNYAISSNANWLVVSKNATGVANQNGVDIELTANTAGLSAGVYNATITATGTGGGTSFVSASQCVTLTVQSKISGSSLITNVVSNTGKSYSLGKLSAGVQYYTDRTYQVLSVPGVVSNAAFVKPSNDDKTSILTTVLSFKLTHKATVYVAYDSRATTLPSWLSGWQKLAGQFVQVNDLKVNNLQIYSKSYLAGTVNLGGNLVTPAKGALTNYFVAAQPSPDSVTNNTSVNGTTPVVDSKTNFLKWKFRNRNSKFHVFPNPNPGNKIHIEASDLVKNELITLTLQDLFGKVIETLNVTTDDSGAFTKDVMLSKHLSKGLYIINANSKLERLNRIIVIN